MGAAAAEVGHQPAQLEQRPCSGRHLPGAFSWSHSGADCIPDDSERHFATRVMCTATICHVPFGLAQTVVTR
jgi:hypothetical protein